MNFRKLLMILIAASTVVLVVLFLVYGKRGEHYRPPYADYLEHSKLAYQTGLRLRGEARVSGQEQFDEAMNFYAADNFEQAIKSLKQDVRQHPDSAAGWMYLGVSYYMLNQSSEAIGALEQADRLAPSNIRPHARWYLAQAYLLNGNVEKGTPLLSWLSAQKAEYSDRADSLMAKMQLSDAKP